MQQVRMMYVSTDGNNNKFYNMTELTPEQITQAEIDTGTTLTGRPFLAEWGRVGAKGQQKYYPMSKWDKVFAGKLKKGYLDHTNLLVTGSTEAAPEADPLLNDIMTFLSESSQGQVTQNYELADFGGVTQAQIDEVNVLLTAFGRMTDRFHKASKTHRSCGEYDTQMLALNKQIEMVWSVLPRKMKNLRELKITDFQEARIRLEAETDMVEALAAQAQVATSNGLPITEALGLTFTHQNDLLKKIFPDYPFIKDHDGYKKGRVVNFWQVVHETTEAHYQNYRESDQRFREALYFHGSRNKNWLSIMNTGLLIRPPGVTTNGDMFGTGIYFASQPMKSLGYTDMDGVGRWASGDDHRAFVAVFKVNIGKQFHLKNKGDYKKLNIYDEDEMGLQKLRPFSYDSVWVHSDYSTSFGQQIFNDEYIVFEAPRATICGLVEVRPT